jgi:hypothetical protein
LTKKCKFCALEFPFYKGNRLYCSKKCAKDALNKRARATWHKIKHTQKSKDARKKTYLKNKDKYLECSKKWYWNNRDRRNKIRRKWELKQYGITIEQYDEMYQKQEGKCLICSGTNTRGYTLAVDHNHTTKVVRGLLCSSCNSAIGLMKDSTYLLKRMIFYLESEAPQ